MKKFLFVIVIIFSLLGIGAAGAFFWYNNGNLKEVIIKRATESIISKMDDTKLENNNYSEQNAFREALGFYGPKTYLILFLNNTELRPGGGFIGTYAVVKMDKGLPKIIQVDGTENLAVNHDKIPSPKPIADHLMPKELEFRDSNWWPDFASSSQYSLATYKSSSGVLADEIDAIIGFTPTVFEEILKFQVIQPQPDRIRILLVVNDKFDDRTKEVVYKGLVDLIGKNVIIEIEIVEEIPLLSSGKRRFIIRDDSVKPPF